MKLFIIDFNLLQVIIIIVYSLLITQFYGAMSTGQRVLDIFQISKIKIEIEIRVTLSFRFPTSLVSENEIGHEIESEIKTIVTKLQWWI